MWAFRKQIHKLSSVGLVTPIACGEQVTFNGTFGIFFVDIAVGTDIGIVTLNYEAISVPDRFQISYDGNLEEDSLYVGDGLTGNPPNYLGMVGSTFNNVPEHFWDGAQFVASGDTQNITVAQGDVAAFGETTGNGSLHLFKTTATPITIQVAVIAPLGGTAWDFGTLCPAPAPPAIISQDDLQEEGDTLCVSCATITVKVPEKQTIVNVNVDVDIITNRIVLTAHGFGEIGESVNLYYDREGGTVIGGLEHNYTYQFQVIDANTLEIQNIDILTVGAGNPSFTPIGTNKRVEIVKTGDVPTYTPDPSLCTGTATSITADTNEVITVTKSYKFGISGIKEAGLDNFSSTTTVEVYDDDTNVLEDTYVLTRTHNNTSC